MGIIDLLLIKKGKLFQLNFSIITKLIPGEIASL